MTLLLTTHRKASSATYRFAPRCSSHRSHQSNWHPAKLVVGPIDWHLLFTFLGFFARGCLSHSCCSTKTAGREDCRLGGADEAQGFRGCRAGRLRRQGRKGHRRKHQAAGGVPPRGQRHAPRCRSRDGRGSGRPQVMGISLDVPCGSACAYFLPTTVVHDVCVD